MPRSARILSEYGYYHVVNRGIGRQILFEDEEDYLQEKRRKDQQKEHKTYRKWTIDEINTVEVLFNQGLNYQEINDELDKQDLVRKLQDSILVLNMIDGPLELKLLIRKKIKELGT